MQINLIKKMAWANPEQSYVTLVADTDEGNDLQICTPYGTDSIIWGPVQTYDASLIEAYVEHEIAASESGDTSLSNDQVIAIIDALESRVPGIKEYISNNITEV